MPDDDNIDDLLSERDIDSDGNETAKDQHSEKNIFAFGLHEGQLLSRLLTHTHLPGLSSIDQVHLLALADTVSSCKIDFRGNSVANSKSNLQRESYVDTSKGSERPADSLDDCGLRFLLAMKHYNYLQRCLPLAQRNLFQKSGVGTSNIVWAFHSESQEELLNLIPSYNKTDLKWSTLKELGVGWWIKNITLLRQCFERLAKAAYQTNQNPLDAALYYCSMKKKSVLWGLFRSKKDEKMTAFFANDFNDERWRKAALKNAYALLGKQRFEHAVAFFLLANSLNDAVEICLTKLNDIQLALCITRLFESNQTQISPTYNKLLYDKVISDKETNYLTEPNNNYNNDPFLRSITYWIMKDFKKSLDTLLYVDKNNYDLYESLPTKNDSFFSYSSVFYFYVFLRAHPFLAKQRKVGVESPETAFSLMEQFDMEVNSKKKTDDKYLNNDNPMMPLEKQLYFRTAYDHLKAGCPALALDVLRKLPKISNNEKDEMALQIKFVACLKILIEELSTLTSGINIEGNNLRFFLYIWLEKEVEILKILCDYQMEPSVPIVFGKNDHSQFDKENQTRSETKALKISKKLQWIEENEGFLRTLLNYCSLNCGSVSNLAQIRIELMILLQELYNHHNKLGSDVDGTRTIAPLALVNIDIDKIMINDPVDALQAQAQDILKSLILLPSPISTATFMSDIYLLQNLAADLSACIFQCLSKPKDFFDKNQIKSYVESLFFVGYNHENSCLNYCTSTHSMDKNEKTVNSKLYSIFNQENSDAFDWRLLFLESFIAVYLALLVTALNTCNCHLLYRLVGHKFSTLSWELMFGSNGKSVLKSYQQTENIAASGHSDNRLSDDSSVRDAGMWNVVTSMTMSKVKINMKLFSTSHEEEKSNVENKTSSHPSTYVAPQNSIITFLISKPLKEQQIEDGYETSDSLDDSDEYDDESKSNENQLFNDSETQDKNMSDSSHEHSNPNSLSWAILRQAVVKHSIQQLLTVIKLIGIEQHEMPVVSPITHKILQTMHNWELNLRKNIESFGPTPENFIPGCFVDSESKGPPIRKYASLLQSFNTPFSNSISSAFPARRLWNYLVHQESVQEIFVRAVFGSRCRQNNKHLNDQNSQINSETNTDHEPIRIIHKDQESITAFCINKTEPGLLVLATPKELQEIDASLLLQSNQWIEDECELDILHLNKDVDSFVQSSYLIVQTPNDP